MMAVMVVVAIVILPLPCQLLGVFGRNAEEYNYPYIGNWLQ